LWGGVYPLGGWSVDHRGVGGGRGCGDWSGPIGHTLEACWGLGQGGGLEMTRGRVDRSGPIGHILVVCWGLDRLAGFYTSGVP
jgi:hypothetical protein